MRNVVLIGCGAGGAGWGAGCGARCGGAEPGGGCGGVWGGGGRPLAPLHLTACTPAPDTHPPVPAPHI